MLVSRETLNLGEVKHVILRLMDSVSRETFMLPMELILI